LGWEIDIAQFELFTAYSVVTSNPDPNPPDPYYNIHRATTYATICGLYLGGAIDALKIRAG
jgi:hypothetical protein